MRCLSFVCAYSTPSIYQSKTHQPVEYRWFLHSFWLCFPTIYLAIRFFFSFVFCMRSFGKFICFTINTGRYMLFFRLPRLSSTIHLVWCFHCFDRFWRTDHYQYLFQWNERYRQISYPTIFVRIGGNWLINCSNLTVFAFILYLFNFTDRCNRNIITFFSMEIWIFVDGHFTNYRITHI